MIKKSASIYIAGFIFGAISSILILSIYPALYQAFLEFLQRKIEVQSSFVRNLTLMIILNNLLAATLSSYGGMLISRAVSPFNEEFGRNAALLYFLPVGILFVNGEVLGLLAVLYRENLSLYISLLSPHGFFELPAIILSGSIGLEISNESKPGERGFEKRLLNVSMGKSKRFFLVIVLVIIGGLLEGG